MARAKICGLTTVVDAHQALVSGADYLGFILYPPSLRAVTAEQVKEIIRLLRSNEPAQSLLGGPNRPLLVGVFVNEPKELIAATLDECGLDLAQLSGEEPPEYTHAVESPLVGRAFHAIRPHSRDSALSQVASHSADTLSQAPTLLLDAYHPALRGGTGKVADWEVAAELGRHTPRLMLAGGLTPQNVGAAVRAVRPFAVDVASGVEASPGRKDPDKVRRFIVAAHAAEG